MSHHDTLALAAATSSESVPVPVRPALFELRQYAARRGRRDELVSMFEAHFLDAYERVGTCVLGSFLDLDSPSRWVWIRAFGDPAGREAALQGFYGGEVWRTRATACNACIADASDARLFRAVRGEVLEHPPPRPPWGEGRPGTSVVEALVLALPSGESGALVAEFEGTAARELALAGATPLAAVVSPEGPPMQSHRPCRAGHWLVVLSRFESESAHAAYRQALAASPAWPAALAALAARGASVVQTLRLQPTSRSALR